MVLRVLFVLFVGTAIAVAAQPVADYAVFGAIENHRPAVDQITLAVIGPADAGMIEWQMTARLAAGGEFAVRAVSERVPMTSADGPGQFARYLFRDSRGKVSEYRDARTGAALLPAFDFVHGFLPTCRRLAPMRDGFATTGGYLGHIATLRRVSRADPAAPWAADFTHTLNPEMIVGILWSMKDDGTGQKADKDYKYVELTDADYAEMVAAGCNYFGAPPAAHRPLLQDRSAFYCLPPEFPEDFYRSTYCGTDMLTDEPGIRLGLQGAMTGQIWHPSQVADLLTTRVKAMYDGPHGVTWNVQNAVKAKASLGTLDLRQRQVAIWETLYESSFYQLAGGAPGIVHEGRYQRQEFGWQPDTLFGPKLEFDFAGMLRCHYAVMRGAARAFDRNWGTSLYGQSNPKFRELALTLAYDMGARWFWLWSADHDHHLPHAEKLRLLRALKDYARAHPRKGRDELIRSAGTAIAFPWGYAPAWDNLYGLGTLSLGHHNGAGVPYRDVVAAGVWEGILCAMRGEDFDFTVDHPGLDGLGYKRVLRVSEQATVAEWPARAVPKPVSLVLTAEVTSPTPLEAPKPAAYVIPCAPVHGRTPAIDADLADWSGPWVDLPGTRFELLGKSAGPQDLSARIALAYDDANLYFAADVTDDVHRQAQDGWWIWDGDCVQIALDPLNARNAGGFTQHQHEFGFALKDGKPVTWRWFGQEPPGPIPGVRVVIRRDEDAHRTRYEAAIPLELLRPLMPGRRYAGVCVVVADADAALAADQSGEERKAWIETSPRAMTDGKHPDRFGSLEFLPPDAKDIASRAKGTWAMILAGDKVIPSGGALRWGLQLLSLGAEPASIEARAEVESLSPLPRAVAAAAATFACGTAAESRELRMRLDVPPGRYRLTLRIRDVRGNTLAQEQTTAFVHPSD